MSKFENSDVSAPIEMGILPRTNDIGGYEVYRALPFRGRRMVGPFIFWDQMGPGEFVTGKGVDVRPHPHIGLSTVTYLFEGSLDHKDSLGNDMRITPGALNLMTAGRGIVHSERTGQDIRDAGPSNLFGIQSWIAQPKSHEGGAPSFIHYAKDDLPTFNENGVQGRIIFGDYLGENSPVKTEWDTLYVDMMLEAGAMAAIPAAAEERALYIISGRVEIAGHVYEPQQLLVLFPDEQTSVKALDQNVRVLLLGGATMDGPRYIWWNFVSSDEDVMRQAQEDWGAGRFPKVPGEGDEFIPLPEQTAIGKPGR